MIRTLLFDLGNVLVYFSHQQMCAQIAALCGLPTAHVRRLLIDSGLQWDFERGRTTPAEFHARWEKLIGRRVSSVGLARAASHIFQPNPDMPPLLRKLRDSNLRLVLLSNTCQSHFEHIRDHFSVLDSFDAFVLSYEAGAIKPEPGIFDVALKTIECPPGECFYTDDIPEYVAAGKQRGLQGAVFTSAAQLRFDLKQAGVEV